MVFWECAGTRCENLRDLGAADLNMFLLPPVSRACSEADMQLTVCRVILAAGIKPAYRSSTASKLALGLVASGWLLGWVRPRPLTGRAHISAASATLQHPRWLRGSTRECRILVLNTHEEGASLGAKATAQSSKAGLGVARWCSTRVTVWDHHCHM